MERETEKQIDQIPGLGGCNAMLKKAREQGYTYKDRVVMGDKTFKGPSFFGEIMKRGK